jgi:transcriptional regulator with XRE-family HTH domain
MSIFMERLRKSRESRNLLQKDVARCSGLSEKGYQNYERGIRKPNADTLTAIADYFDVSVDYLIGRTENPNSHKL